MPVLDIGCGTGSISKDIAKIVGKSGKVIGIDNTEKFIQSGKETFTMSAKSAGFCRGNKLIYQNKKLFLTCPDRNKKVSMPPHHL